MENFENDFKMVHNIHFISAYELLYFLNSVKFYIEVKGISVENFCMFNQNNDFNEKDKWKKELVKYYRKYLTN